MTKRIRDKKSRSHRYEYDAYGNHKVQDANGNENTDETFIGNINPIRYRSYYYDVETGLYYLQTRYYDPEFGRFISPDDTDYIDLNSLGGLNLYAYCNNNPIMYADPSGHSVIAILIILALTTVAGGVLAGKIAYDEGKRGWELAKSAIWGAALGLAVGGAGIMLAAIFGGVIWGASATVLGVPIAQAFAIGALAFDFTAWFVAPLYGIKMEGVEYEPLPSMGDYKPGESKHPAQPRLNPSIPKVKKIP